MTVIFALLLLRDGLRLGLLLVRKLTCRRSTPFSPGRRAVALAGLGLTVGAYGFKEALRIPAVKTTEIFLRRLPARCMALWLCSLRTCTPRPCCTRPAWRPLWRPSTLCARTSLSAPATWWTEPPPTGTPTWPRWGCCAPATGVYACEGNHEYYADYAGWMRHFAALGLPLLHNAHTVVDIGGTPLVIAGLNDPMAPLFGRPGPDLEKALAGAPAGAATLLLAHQPVGARENAAHALTCRFPDTRTAGRCWALTRSSPPATTDLSAGSMMWTPCGFLSAPAWVCGRASRKARRARRNQPACAAHGLTRQKPAGKNGAAGHATRLLAPSRP